MTSQGCERQRVAGRVLSQPVTQGGLTQSWPGHHRRESGQDTCSHITNTQQDLHYFSLRPGSSKPARDSRHNAVIQMGEEFDSYANDFYL